MRQISNAHYLDVVAKALYMERIMILMGTDTPREAVEVVEAMVAGEVSDAA